MDDFVRSTTGYAFGLFAGWWIWGRKLRDLRRVVDHVLAARNDGSPDA